MTYERLTVVDKDGHIDIAGIWDVDMRREDERKYHAAKNQLAELEDKIERGLLVELPCKVGDPAWYVIAKGEYSTLVSTNVSEIRIVGRGEYIIYLQGTVRKIYLDNSGRNDNAFLCKASAEEKLKELKSK